jgi:hypothetical protein
MNLALRRCIFSEDAYEGLKVELGPCHAWLAIQVSIQAHVGYKPNEQHASVCYISKPHHPSSLTSSGDHATCFAIGFHVGG